MRNVIAILFFSALSVFGQGSITGSGKITGNGSMTAVVSSGSPTPILRWKMTEGTGLTVADTSANGNTGTLSALSAWTTYSAGINAVDCTGAAQYISGAANIATIGGTQNASITSWIKTSANSVAGCAMTGGNNNFAINWNGSTVYCLVSAGGGNYPNCPAPSSGNWHFFALVFDGTQSTAANRVVLYIDGTKQTPTSGNLTQGGAGNPTTLPSQANLGVPEWGYDWQGDQGGVYTDAQIFSVSLTQAQVTAMNSAGPQAGY